MQVWHVCMCVTLGVIGGLLDLNAKAGGTRPVSKRMPTKLCVMVDTRHTRLLKMFVVLTARHSQRVEADCLVRSNKCSSTPFWNVWRWKL